MDDKTKKGEIESEAKKTAEAIKDSYIKTKETLNQIKSETEADLAKKETILNDYIEESNKYKAKKNKQLDLMNEKLKSLENDTSALFAEMDNLTDLMDSYTDSEVIQAVKDRQLKEAKIDWKIEGDFPCPQNPIP